MPSGTVKWFNNAKGFGFILPDDGGTDLFAHYSSIEMDGYRTLKAGQSVTFEVEQGDKGLHASHIKASSTEPNTPELAALSDIQHGGERKQQGDTQRQDAKEAQLAEAH